VSLPLPLETQVRLADPWALALLALVALAALVSIPRERAVPGGVLFSSLALVAGVARSRRASLRWSLVPLRLAAAVLVIVALARPQLSHAAIEVPAEGIDIVLALDVSSSMTQTDFGGKSKIDVSKKVILDFLGGLSQDRVGIVLFAGEGLVLSPLTLDYTAPQRLIEPIQAGKPVPDGTAIGTGLATALNVVRGSNAKAKAVILLTDGENNMGEISPLDAAELARVLGVRLYTIGAVPQRGAPSVDERLLQRMSETAGGKFYKVSDEGTLAAVYQEVSALERSRVGTRSVSGGVQDAQLGFLAAALALLVLQVVLSTTLLRRVP
jgi:Ca-activated chloride channel family protein